MMVYEWDTRETAQGRQWTFIDAYSPRVQALQQGGPTQQPTGLLGPAMMKGAGSRVLGSDVFVTLRRDILSQLDEADIVIIDSLSDLLVTHEVETVRELLEVLRIQVRQRNGLVYMPIKS